MQKTRLLAGFRWFPQNLGGYSVFFPNTFFIAFRSVMS